MEHHPFVAPTDLRLLVERRALAATARLGRLVQQCRRQPAQPVEPWCDLSRHRAVALVSVIRNWLGLLVLWLFCLLRTVAQRSLAFLVVLVLVRALDLVLVFVLAQVLMRSDLLAAYYILVLYLLFKH